MNTHAMTTKSGLKETRTLASDIANPRLSGMVDALDQHRFPQARETKSGEKRSCAFAREESGKESSTDPREQLTTKRKTNESNSTLKHRSAATKATTNKSSKPVPKKYRKSQMNKYRRQNDDPTIDALPARPPPISYPCDPKNPRLLLAPRHLLQYAPVIWVPIPIQANASSRVAASAARGGNTSVNRVNHLHRNSPIKSQHCPVMHPWHYHHQRHHTGSNLIRENNEPLSSNLRQGPFYGHKRATPIRLVGRAGHLVSLIRDSPSPCPERVLDQSIHCDKKTGKWAEMTAESV